MNNLFQVILDFPRPFGGTLRVTQKGYGKIFHPRWGFLLPKYKNLPSEGSPLAPGPFPVAEEWKECRCLCDGIGLGMLSMDHPIKRDDLLEDIPDNKAFFSFADDRAKSHLKWAEAFWLLLGFKSNKECGNP